MDKMLDKLDKAIERTGMRGRKVIASGELEGGLGGSGSKPASVKPHSQSVALRAPKIKRGDRSTY